MGLVTITFALVASADFDDLAAIRIAAMQESLERVGRFDPERARERLRQTFVPEHTRLIYADDERVGFYAFRPVEEGYSLDHLYVIPKFQGRGIGAVVMELLIAEADKQARPIKVGALKESRSNRFYLRHGFTKESESEWDNYYVRLLQPKKNRSAL
jgi:GNAT superfamily N-acetyltransferase